MNASDYVRVKVLGSTSQMKLRTLTAGAVFSAVAALIAGCASPGSPKPPSLRLPLAVKNLQAERWGKSVRLAFTVPERTTDGLLLQGAKAKNKNLGATTSMAKTGALAAEICRVQAGNCHPLARMTVLPNDHATYEDTLPDDLRHGKPSILEYHVRVMNADGRDAGWSNLATAPGGGVLENISQLQVRAVRGGVELHWNAARNARAGDRIEIHRTVQIASETVRASAETMKSETEADPAGKKTPRATDLSAEGFPDAGGVVDTSIQPKQSYEYRAVRVRVEKVGGESFTVHGEPATVVYTPGKDTIPPRIPTGLEAVATPSTGTAKAAIDLSWEPVQDPDLASYNVYRSEESGQVWKKIGNAPSAAFHDDTIESSHTYFYRITSVDSSGNESRPGATARETARSGVE